MVESKSKKTKEGGHSFGGDGLAFFSGNLLSSLTCIVSLFARRHRFWRSLCFWFFVRTGTRGSCGSRCCSPPRERKVDDDGLMPASADEGDDAAPPRLASVAPAAAAAPAISRRRPIATTSGPSLSSSISKRRDGESGERLGHGTRVTKSNRERRKMKEKKLFFFSSLVSLFFLFTPHAAPPSSYLFVELKLAVHEDAPKHLPRPPVPPLDGGPAALDRPQARLPRGLGQVPWREEVAQRPVGARVEVAPYPPRGAHVGDVEEAVVADEDPRRGRGGGGGARQ